MKDISKLFLLIIPYLTLCSGIYHISYWSVFDINGLEIISLSNLIKTSIYPFLSNSTLFFTSALPVIVTSNTNITSKAKSNENNDSELPNWLLKIFYIVWILVATLFFHYRWWGFFPILIAIGFLLFILPRSAYQIRGFTSTQNFNFWFIICIIPAYFFTAGKIQADNIFNNSIFRCIVSNQATWFAENPTKCKYLGESDDRLILSDLYNRNIVYVKKETFPTLQYKGYKFKFSN